MFNILSVRHLFLLLIPFTWGCSSSFDPNKDSDGSATLAAVNVSPGEQRYLEGKALYEKHCADCHESFEQSTKVGKSAATILWALNNVPTMKARPADLEGVTPDIIEAIATALNFDRIGTCDEKNVVGNYQLSRLTGPEFTNAVNDILGTKIQSLVLTETATDVYNFDHNSKFLRFDSNRYVNLSDFLTSSIAAALDSTTSNPAKTLLNCGANNTQCLTAGTADLLYRAFRRPVEPAEVTRFSALISQLQAVGATFQEATTETVRAVFLSSSFLFKDFGNNESQMTAETQLSSYQIASRLSFFLWQSVPDTELLNLAKSGQILKPEVVKSQTARLLQDVKARRFIKAFLMQWGDLRLIAASLPEGMTEEVRNSLIDESVAFFTDLIQSNKSVEAFVNANETYINDPLAVYYDLPLPGSNQVTNVSLNGSPRSGFLTQGSFLASHNFPTSRGQWVLLSLMCRNKMPRPQNIPDLNDTTSTQPLDFRQQLTIHASSPSCRGCHVEMDPIGLSLDNFDWNTGVFNNKYPRTTEFQERYPLAAGKVVNPSGILDGVSFSNAKEMTAILAKKPDVKSCVTQKLASFALGRYLKDKEFCAVNSLAFSTMTSTTGLQDVIYKIVTSNLFFTNPKGE